MAGGEHREMVVKIWGKAIDRSYFKSRWSGEPDGTLGFDASGINRSSASGRPSSRSIVHRPLALSLPSKMSTVSSCSSLW